MISKRTRKFHRETITSLQLIDLHEISSQREHITPSCGIQNVPREIHVQEIFGQRPLCIGLLSGLLCRITLLTGLVTLPTCLHREYDRDRRRGDQSQGHDARRNRGRLVLPDEAADLFGPSRWPRHDRLISQVAPDVLGQIVDRLVALLTILLQRLEADRLQVTLQCRVDFTQTLGLNLTNAAGRLGQTRAGQVVGKPINQQFIEHHAQCIHVASGVELARVEFHLLGAHVLKRADELTGLGCQRGADRIAVGAARNTEVDDLRVAFFINEDVARLEIAMDHATTVAVLDAFAGGAEECKTCSLIDVVVIDVVVEFLGSGHVLHREERSGTTAVVVGARFVDLGDGRMLQLAERLGFKLEAPHRLSRDGPGIHHLDGDVSTGIVLLGQVDSAHAAGADGALDRVAGDGLGHWPSGHAVGFTTDDGGIAPDDRGIIGPRLLVWLFVPLTHGY